MWWGRDDIVLTESLKNVYTEKVLCFPPQKEAANLGDTSTKTTDVEAFLLRKNSSVCIGYLEQLLQEMPGRWFKLGVTAQITGSQQFS